MFQLLIITIKKLKKLLDKKNPDIWPNAGADVLCRSQDSQRGQKRYLKGIKGILLFKRKWISGNPPDLYGRVHVSGDCKDGK